MPLRGTDRRARLAAFAIVGLAIYGDLLKRVFEPKVALILLYGMALAIMACLIALSGTHRHAGSAVTTLSGWLAAVYAAQFLTNWQPELGYSLTYLLYLCVPLCYLFLIPQIHSLIDLRQFALFATLLMVPAHAVGFVQQFVDPSFLVSDSYSEDGGVIVRNFLDEGSFSRYPSIFASADRYSGVAMMQIFLSPFLVRGQRRPALSSLALVSAGLLLGGGSLFIAGARSRIVIVAIAFCIGGVIIWTTLSRRARNRLAARAVLVGVALTGSILAAVLAPASNGVGDLARHLPIIEMLDQTIERGDIGNRLAQSLAISAMPEDVTLLGEGLGVTGLGRPGEFAVRAMWIESGLFWTLVLIAINGGILYRLARYVMLAAADGDALAGTLATGQALIWLVALLTGLSSAYELSTALLLFPTMGVLSIAARARLMDRARLRTWSVPMRPRGPVAAGRVP